MEELTSNTQEIDEVTKLTYNDYDYEIGKITYHNLYNSNSYFIEYNQERE